MNKAMSPGELAKGQFVTVLSNSTSDRVLDGGFVTADTIVKHEDRSGYGALLEVLAVDLPYVVTQEVGSRFKHTRDTRQTTFMEVNEEFKKALMERKN